MFDQLGLLILNLVFVKEFEVITTAICLLFVQFG